jgi:hypothetical protein
MSRCSRYISRFAKCQYLLQGNYHDVLIEVCERLGPIKKQSVLTLTIVGKFPSHYFKVSTSFRRPRILALNHGSSLYDFLFFTFSYFVWHKGLIVWANLVITSETLSPPDKRIVFPLMLHRSFLVYPGSHPGPRIHLLFASYRAFVKIKIGRLFLFGD